MKKLFLIVIPVLVLAAGCQKPEPPKGIVKVVDQEEEPVWGADVYLHAYDVAPPGDPGDSIVVRSGTTGSDGTFSFELTDPAVLTIEAWALETFMDTVNGGSYKDTISGTASIRLEMDETKQQTVILRR